MCCRLEETELDSAHKKGEEEGLQSFYSSFSEPSYIKWYLLYHNSNFKWCYVKLFRFRTYAVGCRFWEGWGNVFLGGSRELTNVRNWFPTASVDCFTLMWSPLYEFIMTFPLEEKKNIWRLFRLLPGKLRGPRALGKIQIWFWILITCDNKMRHDHVSTPQFSSIRWFIALKAID